MPCVQNRPGAENINTCSKSQLSNPDFEHWLCDFLETVVKHFVRLIDDKQADFVHMEVFLFD